MCLVSGLSFALSLFASLTYIYSFSPLHPSLAMDFYSVGNDFSSLGGNDFSDSNNFASDGTNFASSGNNPILGGNQIASNDYNVDLSLNIGTDSSGGGGGGGGGGGNDAAPSYNFNIQLPEMNHALHNVSSFLSHHSSHEKHHSDPDKKTPSSPPPMTQQHTGLSYMQPQFTGIPSPAPMYSPPGTAAYPAQHPTYTGAPMSVQYTGQHPGTLSQPGMSPLPGMPGQPTSSMHPGMPGHPTMVPQQGMAGPGIPGQAGMPGQPGMPGAPGQPGSGMFHHGMQGQPGVPQQTYWNGMHMQPGMAQTQSQGITIQHQAQPAPAPGMVPMVPMNQGTSANIGSQYQEELMARCARGDHCFETKYGIVGIIMAIALFPIGLSCLL
ncbi:hypothetical protein EUX98_g9014 [Antrodiella citrinella]|uniref:Uncharacterized protein n=1 Tax=Antrodiella citrinella TaxID=2447956 RepID=A0A4S4M1D2_9APHY|nr:hypothetical protein EUX98_g9014 [Antrodiella citrinella]